MSIRLHGFPLHQALPGAIRKRVNAGRMNRWTIRRAATTGALYATAAAILLVIVFPIYWMFSSSVKTELEFFALPPTWLPSPSLDNYFTAFRTRPLHRYIVNSVVITTVTTVLSVAVGALAGYGFSRFRIAGSRYLLLAMLATRMIPPITLVFPLFVIMRDLGLLNTHAALILAYTTFNIPFGHLPHARIHGRGAARARRGGDDGRVLEAAGVLHRDPSHREAGPHRDRDHVRPPRLERTSSGP